jgi:hypothetical protein
VKVTVITVTYFFDNASICAVWRSTVDVVSSRHKKPKAFLCIIPFRVELIRSLCVQGDERSRIIIDEREKRRKTTPIRSGPLRRSATTTTQMMMRMMMMMMTAMVAVTTVQGTPFEFGRVQNQPVDLTKEDFQIAIEDPANPKWLLEVSIYDTRQRKTITHTRTKDTTGITEVFDVCSSV